MNTAAMPYMIATRLLGRRPFQKAATIAAIRRATAAPMKNCCARAKKASFPTSAVLTPRLTRMSGSTQQEAPTNAASPDNTLPPAKTPPFFGRPDEWSSLDIDVIVGSVVTTGTREMTHETLTIGKLSDQTGVKIETIRYYEKIGIMPPPPRTAGGQRVYVYDDFDRLAFIRRCRDLGFSLDSVRSLLGLNDQPPSCADVQSITQAHLATVKKKIADLRRLERTLTSISKDCTGGDTPDCPIIDALSTPSKKKS